MRTQLKIIITGAIVLLLAACASIQPRSPKIKQQIKAVKIYNQVPMPAAAKYAGPETTLLSVFAAGHENAVTKDYTKLAQNTAYSPAVMFKKQFKAALKNDTHYKIITNGKADATICLSVDAYGFIVPRDFTDTVAPFLQLEAKMIRNNNVVWYYKSEGRIASGVSKQK